MNDEMFEGRGNMVQRIVAIKQAGTFAAPIDRVVLDAGDRQRRRIVLTGERGTRVLLDFADPVKLRGGEGLLLDNGSVVEVVGAAEPLVEVSARTPAGLVRLAWHIGNRHTDIQFAGKTFRIRRDHVLEEMLKGLGATVQEIEAPFDPEPTAPGGGHQHD
jgi:urease accessory protein